MNKEELLKRRKDLLNELYEIELELKKDSENTVDILCNKLSICDTCSEAIKICTRLSIMYNDNCELAKAIHNYTDINGEHTAYNHLIALSIHSEDTTIEFKRFVSRIEDYIHLGFIPFLG